MSEEAGGLSDDITFLRRLAEAGRNKPISGGALLVATGGIWGGLCLLGWSAWIGFVRLGAWANALGLIGIALSIAAGFVFTRGRHKAAAAGLSSLAFQAAWTGAAVGILVIAFIDQIAMWRTGNPLVFVSQSSIFICLYGIAWFISSALARRWWFLAVAVASFAMAIVIALLPYGPTQLLGLSIAVFALTVVPGAVLMRQEAR